MSWSEHALCKDHPEVNWFPAEGVPKYGKEARLNVAAAKAICAGCPVKAECLAEALALPYCAGIWGGTTEDQRKGWNQRHHRINHGTDSGYQNHRRRGEEACPDCRRAHSVASRDYKRRESV